MSVAENRQHVIKVMKDVVRHGLSFNIHSLDNCIIGHSYREECSYNTFSEEAVSLEFSLPVKVCEDVFALNSKSHKGDNKRSTDAAYHLRRLQRAFAKHPLSTNLEA